MLLPYSIFLCHAAIIVFLFLWITEGGWNRKLKIASQNYSLIILTAFAALLVLGVTYSENKNEAWFALEKKAFFFLVPIAIATTQVEFSDRFKKILLSCFTLSCFAGAMICLLKSYLQMRSFEAGELPVSVISFINEPEIANLYEPGQSRWLFFSYIGLARGISIHPTYFSLYISTCCLFLTKEFLSNAHSKTNNYLIGVLIAFFTTFLIFLSSKIFILLMSVIYVSVIIYRFVYIKNKIKTIGICAVAILVISIVMINPVTRYRNVGEWKKTSMEISENKNYRVSTEIRASLWWIAWNAWKDSSPLMGAGTGDVKLSMKKTSDDFNITNVLQSNDPHNEYLYILIGNGLLGLTLFLFYLGIMFWKNLLVRDFLTCGMMTLLIIMFITESALELQKGIVFFALMIPLLSARKQWANEVLPKIDISGAGN